MGRVVEDVRTEIGRLEGGVWGNKEPRRLLAWPLLLPLAFLRKGIVHQPSPVIVIPCAMKIFIF